MTALASRLGFFGVIQLQYKADCFTLEFDDNQVKLSASGLLAFWHLLKLKNQIYAYFPVKHYPVNLLPVLNIDLYCNQSKLISMVWENHKIKVNWSSLRLF